MTGTRDSDDVDSQAGSRSGQLLLVAGVALAVGATAVLVLTDSAQWLRLGVLAALWAALLGAFVAAKYRRQVADRESQVVDLQSVYELELEREVAARREYELEVEAEARRRVQEESREDLAALRTELRALRENLERLTGGEVLVERFALQAQSTRMRTIGEQRSILAGERAGVGSIEAGYHDRRMAPVAHPVVEQPKPAKGEPPTELIEWPSQPATNRREQPRREQTPLTARAAETTRVQPPPSPLASEGARSPLASEGARGRPGAAAARAASGGVKQPSPAAAKAPVMPQQPPTSGRPPVGGAAKPAVPTDARPARGAFVVPENPAAPGQDNPIELNPIEFRAEQAGQTQITKPVPPAQGQNGAATPPASAKDSKAGVRSGRRRAEEQPTRERTVAPPAAPRSRHTSGDDAGPHGERPGHGSVDRRGDGSPDQSSERASYRPESRRRAAERDGQQPAAHTRLDAAMGEPDPAAISASGPSSGVEDGADEQAAGRHGTAEAGGAHTAGRSVTELLAVHGAASGTRRRRRHDSAS